jgi:hypothetical protein
VSNEIVKINPTEFGIETTRAAQIEAAFKPMLEKMTALEGEFNQVMALPINEDTCKLAKRLRLEYVRVRTGTDKIHKVLKEEYLRGGRFIDGWKNAQLYASSGIEDKLEGIEKHFENAEKERIAKLEEERISLASKFDNDARMMKLGQMPEEVWNNYILGVELSYNHRKEAERKVAEERKAAAEAKAARQIEIQKENLRLKAEAEEREKAAQKEAAERAKVEAERKEKEDQERQERLREQALREVERVRIQAEHEAQIAAERKAREAVEEAARQKEAAEQKRIAEEAARAKDKEHKRNVNNTAVLDFVASGLSEKDAMIAVKAIASGKVSNVVIKY